MGKMTCIAVDVWVGKPVLRFSLSNTGPSCVQKEPNLVTFHINTIFHAVELLGIAFCPLTSRKYTLLVQKTSESSSCCNFAKSMSSCEPLVKVMQWFSITYHFRSNDFTHSFFSCPNTCLFKAPAKSLSCLVWQHDETDISSMFHRDLMILRLGFNFHSFNSPWLTQRLRSWTRRSQ